MNEVEKVFNKVSNEDNTRLFRIKTEWEENVFRIFIIDGSCAWFASVTEYHINMLAEQHELESSVYFQNLKHYICVNQSNVCFDVNNNTFIIYRRTPTEKLRLKYFFIKLEKVPYGKTVESFFDNFITQYSEALTKLKKIEEEKLEAVAQKHVLEKYCEDFVEIKRKSDLELYSAFVLTMNEKKQRIRFLTELLETRPSKEKSVSHEIKKQEFEESNAAPDLSRRQEVLSDSESNRSEGYNTDDEKRMKSMNQEPIPSTSKANYDFLGDDSPVRHLPKRVKVDESIVKNKNESIVKNENESIVQNENEIKTSSISKNLQQMNVDKKDSDDEQHSDFDTQELLDRM